MNEYEVRLYSDNIYALYRKDYEEEYEYKGTLPEINAYLELKEKGLLYPPKLRKFIAVESTKHTNPPQ